MGIPRFPSYFLRGHPYIKCMNSEPTGITRYQPLVVILALNALMAVAMGQDAMRYFMGFFFVTLAMFKLFDLNGFADGFQKYDLLAKQTRAYAYVYPFLELGLGLAYLAAYQLVITQWATVVLMLVSAAGVVREIRRGNQFQCACLGTVLNVPLSTVSVVENLGMGLMAGWMLF